MKNATSTNYLLDRKGDEMTSMKNHFQQICSVCNVNQVNYIPNYNDGKIEEEDINCDFCGKPYKIIMFENMTDIDLIIEVAEMSLENLNRHSITGLPQDIWNSIKDDLAMFSDEHKAKIARNMVMTFEAI